MKKSIFILAALLAATFANAQITLEHTFSKDESHVLFPYVVGNSYYSIYMLGDILETQKDGVGVILDLNTYAYKNIPTIPDNAEIWNVAKGYFTADSRVCFVVWTYNAALADTDNCEHLYIYDENGTIIQDLGGGKALRCGFFPLRSNHYKFFIDRFTVSGNTNMEIYSLPGNGDPSQGIESPSTPRKLARKVLQKDQVRIENIDHTYTLTGQEIK